MKKNKTETKAIKIAMVWNKNESNDSLKEGFFGQNIYPLKQAGIDFFKRAKIDSTSLFLSDDA
ncbi:MAG: hypothetical protein R6T83_03015, partial [Salinibacter sp.]